MICQNNSCINCLSSASWRSCIFLRLLIQGSSQRRGRLNLMQVLLLRQRRRNRFVCFSDVFVLLLEVHLSSQSMRTLRRHVIQFFMGWKISGAPHGGQFIHLYSSSSVFVVL